MPSTILTRISSWVFDFCFIIFSKWELHDGNPRIELNCGVVAADPISTLRVNLRGHCGTLVKFAGLEVRLLNLDKLMFWTWPIEPSIVIGK